MRAPATLACTSPTDDEYHELLGDLNGWLPEVLYDAAMRHELESAARQVVHSASCLVAGRVFHAITGCRAPSRLTTAVALLFIGVELLDDVADGDIPGGPAAEAQASLLGCTILASLAPQAVASTVPAVGIVEALGCIWRGLQAMACGQRVDLALFGESAPEPRVVEAALAKSTAECGMYAALGASAAGCSGTAISQWEQFGAALGYALEINADCRDVIDPSGRDITGGARTLPIALALRGGDDRSADALRKDLDAAAHDPSAHERARQGIIESGSLIACGTLVEAAVARAANILATLAPPYGASLRTLLSETSFLRSQ